MRTICLIPARGDSKRIPRKNIRPFLGRPIIEYPIDTAKQSGIFSDIIVYTDNAEIRDIAIKAGASYMPRETVSDNQSTTEMLIEFLKLYKKINNKLDYVCILYPTSVFVTRKEVEVANMNHEDDAIITFCKYAHPTSREFVYVNNKIWMFHPENQFKNTSELPVTYYDAGQMYFLNVKSFLEQKRIFMDNIYPIIIDAVDIDNPEDWKKAEAYYKSIHE